jgi:hypothetical protein
LGGAAQLLSLGHITYKEYMKTAILILIIVILACSLCYEIVQKKRAVDAAVAANQKEWMMSAVTDSLRNYEALDRGDIGKVKEHLMLLANVSAKGYNARFGSATDTKFAADLSEAIRILDEFQAANKQAR